MKRIIAILSVMTFMLGASVNASAQLNKLLQKAKEGATRIGNALGQGGQGNGTTTSSGTPEAKSTSTTASGKTYYVNAATGSNRNDGLTKETAIKDLQKAINRATTLRRLLLNSLRQALAIKRLNKMDIGCDILHLIGLQMTNHMPLNIIGQHRLLCFQLLRTALAKGSLTSIVSLLQRLNGVELRHRQQLHALG